MREIINKGNEKLLKRYEMICRNKGLTEQTIISFCHIELPLFMWYIGETDLSDVNHIIIEDFFDYCATERKNGASALARKYTTLNSFFETMIRKDYFPETFKNPLYKVDKIKTRDVQKDYLTEDELEQVFDYLEKTNDIRGLALIHLMYSSACRISEIVQLNKDGLNMKERTFYTIGKGRKPRMCVFSQKAKQHILNYLETRDDELEPLFVSRENNRLNKRTIQSYVKELVKKVGIKKKITPHSFRHSCLTHLRLKKVPIEDLQLIAGHSQISTTQSKYTHVGMEDIRDKIDEFF